MPVFQTRPGARHDRAAKSALSMRMNDELARGTVSGAGTSGLSRVSVTVFVAVIPAFAVFSTAALLAGLTGEPGFTRFTALSGQCCAFIGP